MSMSPLVAGVRRDIQSLISEVKRFFVTETCNMNSITTQYRNYMLTFFFNLILFYFIHIFREWV